MSLRAGRWHASPRAAGVETHAGDTGSRHESAEERADALRVFLRFFYHRHGPEGRGRGTIVNAALVGRVVTICALWWQHSRDAGEDTYCGHRIGVFALPTETRAEPGGG